MKKILLLLCILIFVGNIKAQKFAYVDSQFILEHIPEYKQAKQELDNISYKWQEEIETAYQDIVITIKLIKSLISRISFRTGIT